VTVVVKKANGNVAGTLKKGAKWLNKPSKIGLGA